MKNFILKRSHKFIIVFIIFFTLVIGIFYKIDRDLKPVMMAACDYEARLAATEVINISIKNEFSNKLSYDNIMKVKTDKEGNIVMIQANTVELNRIGSDIALSVQDKIKSLGEKGIKIPMGVMFKNNIFSYYGPKITFKMQPIGYTTTTYRSEFKAAGINQTKQTIYLDVTANVQVLIPLARNSISITSSIPIAESIIIGKVPNTFVDFGGSSDKSQITNYGIPKIK